ncbi:MAG: Nre family DNA repair protein [archaeon]
MSSLCVKCKGVKRLCWRPVCPLLIQMQTRLGLEDKLIDNELVGQAPSVFVGDYNYPKVFVGPLAGRDLTLEDESSKWYGTPLDKIIDYRSQLFRGKEAVRADEAKKPTRFLETIQEIAMSETKVDADVVFKKKPKFEITFSSVSAPFGPSAETQRVVIESNPKVPRATERVVNDELKAADGMLELYNHGITMDEIQRILSVGLLGINKKLVPTRWSITASDDAICRRLMHEIRSFNELNDYLLFESNYLSNHFQVILIPGKWSFEQIEYYSPGSVWVKKNEPAVFMSDHETFYGRTKYAENVAGGYYAGRLAVCEGLMKMKRQAACIVVREISEGYYAPVGVWEVRENVRHAMRSKPERFASLWELLEHVGKSFKASRSWEKHSELLKNAKSREAMKSFMG